MGFYYIADIFTSSFSPLDPPATGPHGSYFTHQTGVITDSTTIHIPSDFGGMDVALGFAVFDLEDRVVDTAVLIDNIDNGLLMPPFGDFSGGLLGPGGFIVGDAYSGNVHLLPDGSLSGVDTTGFTGNYAYLSTGPEAMIPEPATVVLLGIGLAGLGGGGYLRRWRRTQ